MKLYNEFEDALLEVAAGAKEKDDFEERFIKMIKNYMNGMIDRPNMEDVIEETIILGDENED